MESLGEIWKHPEELYLLLKLKMAVRQAGKRIPPEPHWGFCYSMLFKFTPSKSFMIHELCLELRNAVCIFYLVLRALDTVEDDTSVATEVKVPILMAFHRHIYDRNWHFTCGTKEYKVLMDQFHHVSTAFLELGRSYQEAIEEITMRMGAGMAKFICKEVETIDEYEEYCYYVAGLVALGLLKILHASGLEISTAESLFISMGLFLQKTNIIRDYFEDINEIPKSRMFWPRQIWSKYVNKLEVQIVETAYSLPGIKLCNKLFIGPEQLVQCALGHVLIYQTTANVSWWFITEECICIGNTLLDIWGESFQFHHLYCQPQDMKYEENSAKAVHCLNDMVTNSLLHVEDCLKGMSDLRDPAIVRFCAMAQIVAIGTLALCYNNIDVFRGVVKLRHGLTAKIIDRTRTMADVYGAFYDFSCMLKSKVDMDDPNAMTTLSRIKAIQETCRNSGTLTKRKSYILESEPKHNSALIVLFLILTILFAYLLVNRSNGSRSTL